MVCRGVGRRTALPIAAAVWTAHAEPHQVARLDHVVVRSGDLGYERGERRALFQPSQTRHPRTMRMPADSE
jgi:hypothetical protein